MRLTNTHRRDLVNFAAKTFDPVELRPKTSVVFPKDDTLQVLKSYGLAREYDHLLIGHEINPNLLDADWIARSPSHFMRVTPREWRTINHPFARTSFKVPLPEPVMFPVHTTLGTRDVGPKGISDLPDLDHYPVSLRPWMVALAAAHDEVMGQMPDYLRARMELIHAAVAIIANTNTWEEIIAFWPEVEKLKPVPPTKALVPVPEGAIEKLCANMRTRGVTCNAP